MSLSASGLLKVPFFLFFFLSGESAIEIYLMSRLVSNVFDVCLAQLATFNKWKHKVHTKFLKAEML